MGRPAGVEQSSSAAPALHSPAAGAESSIGPNRTMQKVIQTMRKLSMENAAQPVAADHLSMLEDRFARLENLCVACIGELSRCVARSKRLFERLAFADEILRDIARKRDALRGNRPANWHLGYECVELAESYFATKGAVPPEE